MALTKQHSLVERLRSNDNSEALQACEEAADEIERLESRVATGEFNTLRDQDELKRLKAELASSKSVIAKMLAQDSNVAEARRIAHSQVEPRPHEKTP